MEPVTHAIVGLMIGSKAGPISFTNGALVASTLGAVAPDFDIVAQLWGDYAYLKQHRGFSHSIPGLVLISLSLGTVLTFLYPGSGFFKLAFWTFIGAISHSFLDLFNSYGVNLIWPFSRKKWTINLLMIFDPVLLLLLSLVIAVGNNKNHLWLAGGLFVIYLTLRFIMRMWAYYLVKKRLAKRYPQVKVIVLPSARYFFKWDFIASLPDKNIVGTVNLFRRKFRIVRRLRCINGQVKHMLAESILGKVFREFTPLYHIHCEIKEDMLIAHFIDLRYCIRGRFLHNGTLVMDREMRVKEAIFQPFSMSRRNYLNIS